jgi:hypothetical protein
LDIVSHFDATLAMHPSLLLYDSHHLPPFSPLSLSASLKDVSVALTQSYIVLIN